MSYPRRRDFLLAVGGAAASVSGCAGPRFPGSGGKVDVTLYIGSYHWGFVLVDERGDLQEKVVFDLGSSIKIVAFNTSAKGALGNLPANIRDAIPSHEALEKRNEGRVPEPSKGNLHELLENANQQYPNHSLAVMPAGRNHMRGGMGGMMLHPLPLPANATSPTTARLSASQRGEYTLSCTTYCGYGHPYMNLVGALVVK